MFTLRQDRGAEVDDVLDDLPAEYVVAGLGEARFVAGSPGAFVVQAANGDVGRAAAELTHTTAATRASLADHLAWVPFIDSLLVVPDTDVRHAAATVVPADLLLQILVEGHQPLDAQTVARVRALVHARRLTPPWAPARPTRDDTMAACGTSTPLKVCA